MILRRHSGAPAARKTLGLQALYYPYARSLDTLFLKQNLLLFDQLVFWDPVERGIRESFHVDRHGKSGVRRWDSIKDDYAYLEEVGAISIVQPFAPIREFDGLLAQAMICDLQDDEFMKAASELGAKDYWGIFRKKIPADTLLADAISFHGTRFWRDPTQITSSKDVDDFHQRHLGTYQDFSSPFIMSVAHDYIPVSCGYSVNINVALLLSELNDFVPMTDDVTALLLMKQKYLRASKFQGFDAKPKSILAQRSPEFFQKLGLVGLNLVSSVVPSESLSKRSFRDIQKLRIDEGRSFERFQTALRKFTSAMTAQPWATDFDLELIKMIDKDILPELQKSQDAVRQSYEKMFGGIAKKSIASITPTLAVSLWAGLSSGQILSLSCAAAASALTIALPEIIDLWQNRRDGSVNALNFLYRASR